MKKIICLLILGLVLSGCVGIDNYFIKKQQERNIRDIEEKYQNISYDDGIDKQEAEVIVAKYINDNGWPWPMMGGVSEPFDKGDKWVVEYVGCFTGVQEDSRGVVVDKKTGVVSREP